MYELDKHFDKFIENLTKDLEKKIPDYLTDYIISDYVWDYDNWEDLNYEPVNKTHKKVIKNLIKKLGDKESVVMHMFSLFHAMYLMDMIKFTENKEEVHFNFEGQALCAYMKDTHLDINYKNDK